MLSVALGSGRKILVKVKVIGTQGARVSGLHEGAKVFILVVGREVKSRHGATLELSKELIL